MQPFKGISIHTTPAHDLAYRQLLRVPDVSFKMRYYGSINIHKKMNCSDVLFCSKRTARKSLTGSAVLQLDPKPQLLAT